MISASYFDEISKDTGKYCFGIQDTISALEQGAVEKLIIWEHLDIKRYVFRNPGSEGIGVILCYIIGVIQGHGLF